MAKGTSNRMCVDRIIVIGALPAEASDTRSVAGECATLLAGRLRRRKTARIPQVVPRDARRPGAREALLRRLLAGGAGPRRLRMKDELLRAPVGAFSHVHIVFRRARELVRAGELFQLASGLPNHSEYFAVEGHLENPTGPGAFSDEHHLVRPWRDADGVGRADAVHAAGGRRGPVHGLGSRR